MPEPFDARHLVFSLRCGACGALCEWLGRGVFVTRVLCFALPAWCSDEVNATRMGFQESNAAHQRTAEQSHALEEELYNTRTVVESLRAESAALKAKVNLPTDHQF